MRDRVAVLLVLAVLVGGCTASDGPVALRTLAPNTVCALARVGGVLVADATYGLAFKGDGGVVEAIWPHGYSARRESGVVVLIDPLGHVVAREGDTIVAAGSVGDDLSAHVECDITVNPSPSP